MGYRLLLCLACVLALLHSASEWLAPRPPAPAPVVVGRVEEPPPPTPEARLAQRKLAVPVQGVPRNKLRDTFNASRGKGRAHEAIDIMAPWGTPVIAADDGEVVKISRNRAGGLTLYQADASGRFVYYYAHLAGYADHLREGQPVRRGDVLAYVGSTGNATTPHLHFAVMLHKESLRWKGAEVVNPYPALALAGATDGG
ncbi:M23 family metallopeptidase [Ramlibacter albus]|uniref:M23 family metallopeptidase n=1 Tax=Ramlibacter albus TaxID=2079448 RepID=A0A923M4F5_9BURK|nr:M23 family metallopeptidase [Ramlibacter albus]MBC5764007.1 M23 family metallopeptidase [Ramlibacter albus]